MRTRLRPVLGLALAATLLAGVGAASATPTPVMDGKKVRSLTLKASGGNQTHDTDLVSLSSAARVACKAPRCASLRFVYQPARGVRDGLMFEAKWQNPASDIDLYVGQVGRSGRVTELARCGAAAGTSEEIFVPATRLKPGTTYVLVADFYRSVSENLTATVSFGESAVATTVPAAADELLPTNCAL